MAVGCRFKLFSFSTTHFTILHVMEMKEHISCASF